MSKLYFQIDQRFQSGLHERGVQDKRTASRGTGLPAYCVEGAGQHAVKLGYRSYSPDQSIKLTWPVRRDGPRGGRKESEKNLCSSLSGVWKKKTRRWDVVVVCQLKRGRVRRAAR